MAGQRLVRSRRFLTWLFRGTSPHPEAWSESDIENYARVLDEPARARAQALLYRTFLTRELPAIARGRYRSRRLTVPTLLLFGTRDALLSESGLRGYEQYADRMNVELLEGEGHFVHEESPTLVAERAARFFAEAA